MKLKEIKEEVKVLLTSDEECEELIKILHENGFTWYGGENLLGYRFTTRVTANQSIVYYLKRCKKVTWSNKTENFLTLEEFKDKYLITETQSVKLEPKFKVGDKVRINLSEYPYNKYFDGIVSEVVYVDITESECIYILKNITCWKECYIEPYTGPNLKVGDKVRISLDPKNPYGPPCWVPEMDKFKGKIVTLKDTEKGCWKIEEDDGKLIYSERWFESYAQEHKTKIDMETKEFADKLAE